jgi:PKD repeat protein
MSQENKNPLDPLSNTPLDPLRQANIPPDSINTQAPINWGQQEKPESMLESLLHQVPTTETPKKEEDEKIRDLQSMSDVIVHLLEKAYDYVKSEPSETNVALIFVKDEREVEKVFVTHPVYNNIVIKIKTATALDTTQINKIQEGKAPYKFDGKNIELISKIAPSELWEKIFLKTKLIEWLVKEKKKVSLGQIFWFLGAVTFVAMVLGWAFITFIILNAKTVEDVRFFYSLGISLNDINAFIAKVVTIIFSILLFIEIFVLSIALFKFYLTKKEFKRKKTLFWVLSAFLLIVTFSTGSGWMYINQKIASLPNWQEVAYWEVQIFDNDMLKTEKFWATESERKAQALIRDTNRIIGPITLKYDLSLFAKRQEQTGFPIKKYIWDFGDGKKIESQNPTITNRFENKGTYNVSLSVVQNDFKGNEIEKKVEDIKQITITNSIKVEEKKLPNWGTQVTLDATDLKDLWKLEWYFEDDTENAVWTGTTFRPVKIFYEEALIGLHIVKDAWAVKSFDKIIVIAGNDNSGISGKIVGEPSIENEFLYNFQVSDIQNSLGNGFIEEFKWIIGDREYTLPGDPSNQEKSSIVEHEFQGPGEQEIRVIMKDADGKIKELTSTINITKLLKLSKPLTIQSNWENIENLRYENKTKEYFLSDLWSPTTLKLDARLIRADNVFYSLSDSDIIWDFNEDGKPDTTGRIADYTINTPGNTVVSVEYTFRHRNKTVSDPIIIKEKIYIEAVKKEAVLDLKIEKESDYVPTFVRFDASRSEVKNDDIIKFIYDYGDGFSEERDAINPGRQYLKEGEYIVKLKVITESGKEYSTTRNLVLKARPEIVKIWSSMKEAPINQGIDFTSAESEGQVTSYLWKFWDGNTSTEANPTHSYKKAGKYEVILKVGYRNNNFLEDRMDIVITE